MANYVERAKTYSDAVYLYQCAAGKERQEPGRITGVVDPVLFSHYESMLAPEFRLYERAPAFTALNQITQSGGYDDALWLAEGERGAALLRRGGAR